MSRVDALLAALAESADEYGCVDTTDEATIRQRLGPDAVSWDLDAMLRRLYHEGQVMELRATGLGVQAVVVYPNPSGSDPRGRVRAALADHVNELEHCAASFADLRSWLGQDADSWDLHEMLLNLRDAGYLEIRSLGEGLGDARCFEVTTA